MSWKVITGDCLEVMPTLTANSIDTIITDPPYGLSFMGKDWDHGVPGVPFWAEALRVAKPGAMLLAFGGSRTFHRLTCAIEDAGWEIRDCIMWVYGSGFPKSHDISKAIDRAAGAERETMGPLVSPAGNKNGTNALGGSWQESPMLTAPATDAAREWQGWGTALKPAWEPIILAMKPLDGTFAENALRWGVAGLNVDGGRIDINDGAILGRNNKPGANGWKNSSGGPNNAAIHGNPSGRWPANVIHDGSEEVVSGFPVTTSGARNGTNPNATDSLAKAYAGGWKQTGGACSASTGSAARFFYAAKASRAERNAGLEGMEARATRPLGISNWEGQTNGSGEKMGASAPQQNPHPTVKPLALMRYLAKLTATPTGGVILDPFCGSGTTGVACMQTGRNFIGIEIDPGYADIARARIAKAAAQARQLALLEEQA